jgi:ElaB/YqjD/DUF883 family membrane-anchored ribosome-binding protein
MNSSPLPRFQFPPKAEPASSRRIAEAPNVNVTEWIVKNPILTICIAISLGAVMGCLIKRR